MHNYDPAAAREAFTASFAKASLKDHTESELQTLVVSSYAAGMANACEQLDLWLEELQQGEATVQQIQERTKELWSLAAEETFRDMLK